MKHPGLFVPLDVNLPSDEGIRRAGIAAELLYVRGLTYAKRTGSNGHLPDYDLTVIGVGLPEEHIHNAVKALVHWELWVPEDGGWYIRSWERWNSAPDEAEKERKRTQARERKRRQREREAAEKKAAEEAEEIAPGQLKLVVPGAELAPENPSGVTRNVTRDSHGVTPPKRREEKRSIKNLPSPDGEDEHGDDSGHEDPKPAAKKIDYTEQTPDFVRFYDAYPRKADRKDACKAWHQTMKLGVDPEHVIAAAERFAAAWDPADRKHTKYPAVWLRKGSYDNAPEDLAPAAGDSRFRGGPRALDTSQQDYETGEVII